jgi:hypothetical protein
MDTDTLFCCLSLVSRGTNVKSVSVVPRDKIFTANFKDLPVLVAVNTDLSTDPGRHWILFYVYKTKQIICADYFDSYGLPYTDYKISFPYSTANFNNIPLQSNESDVCALHVIYFAYKRSRGVSLKDVIRKYSASRKLNDDCVRSFYHRLKLVKRNSNRSQQICCTRLANKF